MSKNLGLNRLKIEFTGNIVTVPNDNIAKLIYYLSCIASVIQYNLDYKLRDYKNYFRLNPEEKTAVYTQAVKLNPKIFIEAGVFKVGSEFLRKGNMNEFIKITDERIGVHVNQELMIGGRSVRVLKIIAFENEWLK